MGTKDDAKEASVVATLLAIAVGVVVACAGAIAYVIYDASH